MLIISLWLILLTSASEKIMFRLQPSFNRFLLYNSNTGSSFLSSHTQNSVSSLHLVDGLRKKMACGSLRTNKTFQMCGRVTLGCQPIFQLGQQSPLLEKRRAFSSPAKADKAQGAHGLSLQAVRVWAERLFVCCGSERLLIPLAPVTQPALCHQQLPGHIRDR